MKAEKGPLYVTREDGNTLWKFLNRKGEYEAVKGTKDTVIKAEDTNGLITGIRMAAQKDPFKDLNIHYTGIYLYEKAKPTVKRVYTSYYATVSNLKTVFREGEIILNPEPVPGLPDMLAEAPLKIIIKGADE